MVDVLVAGAGPAGASLVAACAGRGLRVGWLAPDPDARWTPTYAAWVDELAPSVPLAGRWEVVEVRTPAVRALARPYARIDGEGLREQLRARCGDVTVHAGSVVSAEVGPAGATVRDDRGRTHTAAVFVRATGAGAATAWQTAAGRFVELDGLDPARPRWMDFSQDFDDGAGASFLYALPFPDGTWLVEETALVAGPAVPHALLSRRLDQRLRALGVTVRATHGEERVTIPMDAGAPDDPAAVAFGAAAGMIHPATGYLVARVLSAAPRVAEALAAGLSRSPQAGRDAARAAIWPADALRRHRILRYGAGVLASLGAEDTRRFFDVFFSCPRPFVDGFLGDRLPTTALVSGMADLFRRLPMPLRLRVMAAGDPVELWRAARTPSRTPQEVVP